MNLLVEKGIITELSCGANFAYILNDSSQFLLTEYKVLQSQGNKGFVKCMKMLHNGKMELYYMTTGYKSLASLLPTIDVEGFMTIVANLFQDIIEVKNNGFLSCQNIDLSFEKIFVDMSDYKTYLIYLPINTKTSEDYAAFENELRTSLIKIINNCANFNSNKTAQFAIDLSDGTLSLQDLYNRIRGIHVARRIQKEPESGAARISESRNLKLVAMNAPNRLEIPINKREFVLGKNPALVDGVISFNKAISRKHCKIVQINGAYSVVDLGSANGTYLNKKRLEANHPYPMKAGDILRMANSDFQICEG